ncbi:MAG: LuxR C-terminal-related transcriptional regulator [Dehalococcoidales bacterium]|nr:LuxR C-terminal-related transcriptional regulator [Dehalococcoidales bacterium]
MIMPRNTFGNLSDRELQVLYLLANGKTLHEIAGNLELSVNTVATYRSRVLLKLSLRTNEDLARFAMENRLL